MPELSLQARLAKHLLRLITHRGASQPIELRRAWPDLAGRLRQKRHPELMIVPATIGGVECEWVYRRAGGDTADAAEPAEPAKAAEMDDPAGPADAAAPLPSPEDIASRSVIIYFHGGGYVTGSLLSARVLSTSLAFEMPVRLLSVNYRLAPEHPFPAALLDALSVYDALLAEGWDHSRIGLIGDSAGGGLALAAAMAIRDRGQPLPACLALISPWTDLTGRSPSFREKAADDVMLVPEEIIEYAQFYAGANRPDNPYMSPVYGRFDGLPPMLVHVGSDEMLLDDARRAVAAAQAAGVDAELRIWPGLFHVFSLAADLLPEAQASMAEIKDFLCARLVDRPAPSA